MISVLMMSPVAERERPADPIPDRAQGDALGARPVLRYGSAEAAVRLPVDGPPPRVPLPSSGPTVIAAEVAIAFFGATCAARSAYVSDPRARISAARHWYNAIHVDIRNDDFISSRGTGTLRRPRTEVLRILLMIYAIAIALMVACAIDPKDERAGFGLRGEVHQQAVEDWSFTEDSGEIFIETVTSYWIPHSVTAWCVTVGNELYVSADDADEKRWVANVARNPNVRLEIKGKIYEQRLVPVADPTTIDAIDIGFVRKYEYEEEDEAYEDMTIGYWRVVERE
jgi:hypothetical protein